MSTNDSDGEALARAVRDGMYAKDNAARAMGIEINDIGPNFARAAMTVRDDMLNSHGICHGGVVFMLADTAFAYACNAANASTLALSCTISFTRPGRAGETLVAEAVELNRSGRTGVFDVAVQNARGETVALFRGQSYQVKGEAVPGLSSGE